MFTGIIEEVGVIRNIKYHTGINKIDISCGKAAQGVKIGDSISVNGVCLTITHIDNVLLSFDVMEETINRSSLKNIKIGSKVNLERSLKVGDSVGGHFVYGHIDGVRNILKFDKNENRSFIDIEILENDTKYVIEKGSIAIDGISLTVGKVFKNMVRVFLIPHTLNNTILFDKKEGDVVNVEFDMLAKYLDSSTGHSRNLTKDFLEKTGFA